MVLVARFWNLYRPERGKPGVGDTVRYRDKAYSIAGTVGADSHGTPYVRLLPLDHDSKPVVCLVTAVEKV